MFENVLHHLNSKGYHPDISKISLDQKIIRFDRNGKKNAWLIGFQNQSANGKTYVVTMFGDWKTGEEEVFNSNGEFSEQDKKKIETAKKIIREEKKSEHESAAIDAKEFWDKLSDNPNCEYLKKKQIHGLYGAKTNMTHTGRALVIPMRDTENKIWGYQQIFSDGAKLFGAGQKKSGHFHVIPYFDALGEQPIIYVAEGFSTAASIYEAIEKPVVVAFDAGNLSSVCVNLQTKFPDKTIVVCGDDDRNVKKIDGTVYNPGKEAAMEAASRVMGKAVFPVFANDSLPLTDFNDLMISEGKEKVKDSILGLPPVKETVKFLGYIEDHYYFISSQKPIVTSISKASFNKNSLMDLMPMNYWESRFANEKKTGLDLDAATDALMTGCRSVGHFNPKYLRGTGVWQDQGKTVVNLGDQLWVDDKFIHFSNFTSKYIYHASHVIECPEKNFLTAKDVMKFYNLISQLSWKNSESSKILTGWLMLAGICGSISWRPHIWITGGAGSGKTTVMEEIIGRIIPNSFRVMGRSSEAGIRQIIKTDCLPLLFDENETTDGRSMARVSNVVDLFRQASSETEAQVVKGTPSGKNISFNVRFCAAVSSITVGLTLEQDRSRFCVLEMNTDKNNGFMDRGGVRDQLWNLLTPEFAHKLFSRSVFKYDVWKQNFKTLHPFFYKKQSARFADQYGSIAAAYYMGIMDNPLNEQEAEIVAEEVFVLEEQKEEAKQNNEKECLQYLLNLKISDGHGHYSVSELIDHLKYQDTVNHQKILMQHGMKFFDGKFIVQYKHPELSRLMKDSAWPQGWAKILSRLPNTKSLSVRFFGNNPSYSVSISF